MRRSIPLFLILLSSCTTPTPWRIDTLSSSWIDSTKLSYYNLEREEPLSFDLLWLKEEVYSYLTLTQLCFSEAESPGFSSVTFYFGGEKRVEKVPILEGGMRLKLSAEITQEIFRSLEEEQPVSIEVDTYRLRIEPSEFLQAQKQGKAPSFSLQFKDPFQ